MKKILLISLLLLSVKGFAQITLEQTYPIYTYGFKVASNEWNYCNVTGNTLNIYSLNHSFITSFPLTIPSGNINVNIFILSKGLFVSDTSQYTVEYYSYNSSNYQYTTDIISQNGNKLLEIDSSAGDNVFSTSEGAKLIVYAGANPIHTKIYSLPGTYAAGIARPQGNDGDVNNAYPNPTADAIHLPYTLNGNEQGEIEIVNMNGQLLKQYKVTNAFNDILLYTNELPKGSYLYYLETDGVKSPAKQFLVQ